MKQTFYEYHHSPVKFNRVRNEDVLRKASITALTDIIAKNGFVGLDRSVELECLWIGYPTIYVNGTPSMGRDQEAGLGRA